MSLAIVFRNTLHPNRFRNAILAAASIPGATEILICSGFYQDKFKGSSYLASGEGGFASKLQASGAEVVTVGVHNPTWTPAFKTFNANLAAAGVKVTAKYVKGHRWHAKTFIVSTHHGLVFAAIGSSNMTRNAFSTSSPFNYEADVLLWVSQAPGASAAAQEVLRNAEPRDAIRAAYSASANGGLTVKNRLTLLREQILATVA